MNEEIIVKMNEWYKKVPKPSNRLYLEMWEEVSKQVIKKLEKMSVNDVLKWLKENMKSSISSKEAMNNDNRQGPVWLDRCSQQVYSKLWSIKDLK